MLFICFHENSLSYRSSFLSLSLSFGVALCVRTVSYKQILEIRLSPSPCISSHQGPLFLKITYIDHDEECIAYKDEVPGPATLSHLTTPHTATSNTTTATVNSHTHNTNAAHNTISNGSNIGIRIESDSIVINLERSTTLSGDIKVEFYTKQTMTRRKKTLFGFWFNTFFESERGNWFGV